MAEKNPDRDELEPMEAAVLPAREAMTLISQSTGDGSQSDPSVTPGGPGEHVESDDSD
jgi:hypothetical protein